MKSNTTGYIIRMPTSSRRSSLLPNPSPLSSSFRVLPPAVVLDVRVVFSALEDLKAALEEEQSGSKDDAEPGHATKVNQSKSLGRESVDMLTLRALIRFEGSKASIFPSISTASFDAAGKIEASPSFGCLSN